MAASIRPARNSSDAAWAPTLPIEKWSLDPGITHLNHGAFGGVPEQLCREQAGWRRRMDGNPSHFFMDELFDLLARAAEPLADFVGTHPSRLAFVENCSAGIATVLASTDFSPGDRIVTTSHIYGAVRNMLAELASRRSVVPAEVNLPCPLDSDEQVVDAIAAALEPGARLVIVDHVTSPTSLIMPVAAIAKACRARGVPVLIDGSHAPAMIDLDVDGIGADYYVGSAHKWLCAPRGAAFLVVAEGAHFLRPLVISHAYGGGFPAEFREVGTRDPSAALTVPAAIALHRALGGPDLRKRNRDLARLGAEIVGGAPSGPARLRGAMASLAVEHLPGTVRAATALRMRLREHHAIEVLALPFGGQLWLRLSAHAYNGIGDFERLAAALPHAVAAISETPS